MRVTRIHPSILLICGMIACGDDDKTDTSPQEITITGTLFSHPTNTVAGALDFSGLAAGIINGGAAITGEFPDPLGTTLLDVSNCNPADEGCPFSISGVNIRGIGLGVLGMVGEAAQTANTFVPAATGVAIPVELLAAYESPSKTLAERTLYAVSLQALGYCAALAAMTVEELFSRGAIMGTVIDANRAAVGGAIVTSTVSSHTIYLAPPAFGGTTPGATTADDHGAFCIVPPQPQEGSAGVTLGDISAEKSGMTFRSATGATARNTIYVVEIVAQP